MDASSPRRVSPPATHPACPARIAVVLALLLALAACAGRRPIDHPSPNQDGRVRFLVLHFTNQDFAQSLATLTDPHGSRRVSAHYLISASGVPRRTPRVYRLVPESQRAWHAGASRWQGQTALNDPSIGIELVYAPGCPTPYALPSAPPDPCTYPEFDPAQVARLVRLAREVLARHPDITPARVVGHSDIAPDRKSDPGPAFPWRALHAAGIGAWFEAATVERHREALEQVRPPLDPLLRAALAAYGYGVPDDSGAAARWREVVVAFQTHFRPARRDGLADVESTAIALALVERYRNEALPALRQEYGLPADR
jgi:N-acetyl-anhydromuramyl-L-alanine amidase AmpD